MIRFRNGKTLPSRASPEERLLLGMPQEPTETGCLEWTRGTSEDGYGRFYVGSQVHYAHRVSWEAYNQCKVPEGMCVRHSCDNPSCVNPLHLVVGTQAQNVEDKVLRGRCSRMQGQPTRTNFPYRGSGEKLSRSVRNSKARA